MSFTNFSKTLMLTALLQQTARTPDGKHRIVVAKDGVLLPLAPARYITLQIYGHNPPVITNAEPIQWTATSAWPDINEIYVVNESEGKEILLKGTITNYPMPIGKVFVIPANAWEASLVE